MITKLSSIAISFATLVASGPACRSAQSSPPAAPARAPAALTAPPPLEPRITPTLEGHVLDANGAAVAAASVTITDLADERQLPTIYTDADGAFSLVLPAGSYSIAAASEAGYAWLKQLAVPATDVQVQLAGSCDVTHVRVTSEVSELEVLLVRRSPFTGDSFVMRPKNGELTVCLPPATYEISAIGGALSAVLQVALPTTSAVAISATAKDAVESPPDERAPVDGDIASVVTDIGAARPAIVGLGESTHGTAELTTARGLLTMQLIEKLGTRLLLSRMTRSRLPLWTSTSRPGGASFAKRWPASDSGPPIPRR